jgi:hypothetical protein
MPASPDRNALPSAAPSGLQRVRITMTIAGVVVAGAVWLD